MNKIYLALVFVFLSVALGGCAFDIVHVNQIPVQYENEDGIKQDFELKEGVEISLETGYSRKLNKGTRWHYVNSITYGDIFKTDDQVLTIEGSNIFEAYIVVSNRNLVGFFLPVEQAYSPLGKPTPLTMIEIDQSTYSQRRTK